MQDIMPHISSPAHGHVRYTPQTHKTTPGICQTEEHLCRIWSSKQHASEPNPGVQSARIEAALRTRSRRHRARIAAQEILTPPHSTLRCPLYHLCWHAQFRCCCSRTRRSSWRQPHLDQPSAARHLLPAIRVPPQQTYARVKFGRFLSQDLSQTELGTQRGASTQHFLRSPQGVQMGCFRTSRGLKFEQFRLRPSQKFWAPQAPVQKTMCLSDTRLRLGQCAITCIEPKANLLEDWEVDVLESRCMAGVVSGVGSPSTWHLHRVQPPEEVGLRVRQISNTPLTCGAVGGGTYYPTAQQRTSYTRHCLTCIRVAAPCQG